MEGEVLQPHLEHAQKALETALDEACGVDLKKVNTDELIRIEETLATATKAAKEVVSIRLRRRQQRGGKPRQAEPTERVQGPAADVLPGIRQRIFDDFRGKRWRVFAVYPTTSTIDPAALPAAFREGWLSFESEDEKRRIAPIPEGWEELSTEELRLLCHRARKAPKRPSNPIPPPEASS